MKNSKTISKVNFKNVCVFLGGSSGEREVSLESGKYVLQALKKLGINCFAFDPYKTSLNKLLPMKPDCVFMALHGQPGEDGRYQAFFDLHEIPYTGSGVEGNVICLSKLISKTILEKFGVPIPKFKVIDESVQGSKEDYQKFTKALGSPLVIKPSNEGSSLGISIVKNLSQWTKALKLARGFKGAVLAEQYIDGEEYTFGVIGDVVLPGILIKYKGEFYDYKAKYVDNKTRLVCPSGMDKALEKKLQKMSLKVADALEFRGWYRVDFILDKKNKPYVIEINTAPGMTSHSLIPKASSVLGWSYEETVKNVLAQTKFDSL